MKKKLSFYLWMIFFITSLISIFAIPIYMMEKIDRESKSIRSSQPTR